VNGSLAENLRAFFTERARVAGGLPSLDALCHVSGRDPRLWTQRAVFDDLVGTLLRHCRVDERSSILEVGCAAGYIASGVAPAVDRYTGIDLAAPAIRLARRLRLANARFEIGDGTRLRFADASFDAAFCTHLFINLPTFADGATLIGEMLRVVRPGGRVVVGEVPDESKKEELTARGKVVARDLESRFGSLGPLPARPPGRLSRLLARGSRAAAAVSCFFFTREQFQEFAAAKGLPLEIIEIYQQNPYRDLRFNAIFTKPTTS
jgi:SAM-dependent methyltransferase